MSKPTPMVFQLEVDQISPSEIAALLKYVYTLPNPRMSTTIVCQSKNQAHSVKRRMKENLTEEEKTFFGIKGRDSMESSYLQIKFPPAVESEQNRDLDEETEEVRPVDSEVSTGDFKVSLLGGKLEDRGANTFCDITMEIFEGSAGKSQIKDRVMIWPPSPRAEFLANALGISVETLNKIQDYKGKVFLNRRREQVREDGTTRVSNFYSPLPASAFRRK